MCKSNLTTFGSVPVPPENHWHLLKEACEAQANYLWFDHPLAQAKKEANNIIQSPADKKTSKYAEIMLRNSANKALLFAEIIEMRGLARKTDTAEEKLKIYLRNLSRFEEITGSFKASLIKYWYHTFTYLEYIQDLKAVQMIYFSLNNYEKWLQYNQKIIDTLNTTIAIGTKWNLLLETSRALLEKKTILDHLQSEEISLPEPYLRCVKSILAKEYHALETQKQNFERDKDLSTSAPNKCSGPSR